MTVIETYLAWLDSQLVSAEAVKAILFTGEQKAELLAQKIRESGKEWN